MELTTNIELDLSDINSKVREYFELKQRYNLHLRKIISKKSKKNINFTYNIGDNQFNLPIIFKEFKDDYYENYSIKLIENDKIVFYHVIQVPRSINIKERTKEIDKIIESNFLVQKIKNIINKISHLNNISEHTEESKRRIYPQFNSKNLDEDELSEKIKNMKDEYERLQKNLEELLSEKNNLNNFLTEINREHELQHSNLQEMERFLDNKHLSKYFDILKNIESLEQDNVVNLQNYIIQHESLYNQDDVGDTLKGIKIQIKEQQNKNIKKTVLLNDITLESIKPRIKYSKKFSGNRYVTKKPLYLSNQEIKKDVSKRDTKLIKRKKHKPEIKDPSQDLGFSKSVLYSQDIPFTLMYFSGSKDAYPGQGTMEELPDNWKTLEEDGVLLKNNLDSLASYSNWRKILSNFYISKFESYGIHILPIIIDGEWFPSVEHYFHYCKFNNRQDKGEKAKRQYQQYADKFSLSKKGEFSELFGGTVKSKGQQHSGYKVSNTWNTHDRFIALKKGIYAKFSQNTLLKNILLLTGNSRLLHPRGGSCRQNIYEIQNELMIVRYILKTGEEPDFYPNFRTDQEQLDSAKKQIIEERKAFLESQSKLSKTFVLRREFEKLQDAEMKSSALDVVQNLDKSNVVGFKLSSISEILYINSNGIVSNISGEVKIPNIIEKSEPDSELRNLQENLNIFNLLTRVSPCCFELNSKNINIHQGHTLILNEGLPPISNIFIGKESRLIYLIPKEEQCPYNSINIYLTTEGIEILLPSEENDGNFKKIISNTSRSLLSGNKISVVNGLPKEQILNILFSSKNDNYKENALKTTVIEGHDGSKSYSFKDVNYIRSLLYTVNSCTNRKLQSSSIYECPNNALKIYITKSEQTNNIEILFPLRHQISPGIVCWEPISIDKLSGNKIKEILDESIKNQLKEIIFSQDNFQTKKEKIIKITIEDINFNESYIQEFLDELVARNIIKVSLSVPPPESKSSKVSISDVSSAQKKLLIEKGLWEKEMEHDFDRQVAALSKLEEMNLSLLQLDSHMTNLSSKSNQIGKVVLDMPPNGDCFYYSIAHGLKQLMLSPMNETQLGQDVTFRNVSVTPGEFNYQPVFTKAAHQIRKILRDKLYENLFNSEEDIEIDNSELSDNLIALKEAMKESKGTLENYLKSLELTASHVDKKPGNKIGEWAGNIEMIAAAATFNIDIHIIRSSDDEKSDENDTIITAAKSKETLSKGQEYNSSSVAKKLYLGYLTKNHYVLISDASFLTERDTFTKISYYLIKLKTTYGEFTLAFEDEGNTIRPKGVYNYSNNKISSTGNEDIDDIIMEVFEKYFESFGDDQLLESLSKLDKTIYFRRETDNKIFSKTMEELGTFVEVADEDETYYKIDFN